MIGCWYSWSAGSLTARKANRYICIEKFSQLLSQQIFVYLCLSNFCVCHDCYFFLPMTLAESEVCGCSNRSHRIFWKVPSLPGGNSWTGKKWAYQTAYLRWLGRKNVAGVVNGLKLNTSKHFQTCCTFKRTGLIISKFPIYLKETINNSICIFRDKKTLRALQIMGTNNVVVWSRSAIYKTIVNLK